MGWTEPISRSKASGMQIWSSFCSMPPRDCASQIATSIVVLALNKIALVRGDLSVVLADAVEKLGVTDIIPISAKRGTNVASRLVPSIIDKYPQLAVAIGRELPLYRRQASGRVIRNATALAAVTAGLAR